MVAPTVCHTHTCMSLRTVKDGGPPNQNHKSPFWRCKPLGLKREAKYGLNGSYWMVQPQSQEKLDSLKAGRQLCQCRTCMISRGMTYSDEGCCGNPEEGGSVGVSDPANIHGEEGRLRLTPDRGGVSWGRPQER